MPFAVLLATAVAVVGWHMEQYPYLSPIDENAHFDYVQKVPHVPVNGERLSNATMRLTSCRGYPPDFDYPFPPCSARRLDPNAYPAGGYSTAGLTPPVYYATTAVIAQPLAALTGRELIVTTRAVGALWLAGLMSVIFLLARRLRASRPAALGAALLVGTSTEAVFSASRVGPDVATATAGGLVLLAAVSHNGTRRATLLLLGAVTLAALTKLTTFSAVGVAMIYLVLSPLLGRRQDPSLRVGRSVALSAAVFVVFSAVSGLWILLSNLRSTVPADQIPINTMLQADRIPWSDITGSLFYAFATPITGNWNPAYMDDTSSLRLESVVVGVLVLGALGAALALRASTRASALGLGVVLMALVGPPLLVVLNFYANGLYFPIDPRYGFGLLAGFAAATAWTFRTSGPAHALALLGALSVVSVLI